MKTQNERFVIYWKGKPQAVFIGLLEGAKEEARKIAALGFKITWQDWHILSPSGFRYTVNTTEVESKRAANLAAYIKKEYEREAAKGSLYSLWIITFKNWLESKPEPEFILFALTSPEQFSGGQLHSKANKAAEKIAQILTEE